MKKNKRRLIYTVGDRVDYALHLWSVNSPWINQVDCISLCAERAGINEVTLRRKLRELKEID